MKNCILILSYCDKKEKYDILLKTLSNTKKFNYDIFLYSHYPLNGNDIQNKVNYYLYDYSNPILKYPKEFGMVHWRIFNNKYKLKIHIDDYGYAVIQMFKRGVDFLKILNYERVIILNYDTYIDNYIVDKIEDDLNFKDLSLFYWNKRWKNYKHLNPNIFGLNINNINLNSFNKENFIKKQIIAEDFLHDSFENVCSIINLHDDYKEHFHAEYSINSWDIYNFKDYKIHIGNYNNNVGLLIFSVKKQLNLVINRKVYVINKNSFYFNTYGSWSDFSEYDIEIKIDNNIINKDIIKTFIERKSKIEDI